MSTIFEVAIVYYVGSAQTPGQTFPTKQNMKKDFVDDFLSADIWQKLRE